MPLESAVRISRILVRILARVFYIVPLQKNKLLFISYGGKQYACNPKYIYEYLQQNKMGPFHCVWCLAEGEKRAGIKWFKKSNWPLYFRHNLTAKIIITNDILSSIVPYRKGQIIIYTGHGGGAYKKCGFDVALSKTARIFYRTAAKSISCAISASRGLSEHFTSAYLIPPEKILNLGSPRNDIFFRERPDISDKVRKFYGLEPDARIVLYAPTYRSKAHSASPVFIKDTNKITEALGRRFESAPYVFIPRLHHTIQKSGPAGRIDGNLYHDVQELLYAADALITDYSGIIWDCVIAKKPLFLYTPDLEQYGDERGFYFPPQDWGFPLAETEEALIKNIMDFDREEHGKACEYHKKLMGSYERGYASREAAEFIEKILGTA